MSRSTGGHIICEQALLLPPFLLLTLPYLSIGVGKIAIIARMLPARHSLTSMHSVSARRTLSCALSCRIALRVRARTQKQTFLTAKFAYEHQTHVSGSRVCFSEGAKARRDLFTLSRPYSLPPPLLSLGLLAFVGANQLSLNPPVLL